MRQVHLGTEPASYIQSVSLYSASSGYLIIDGNIYFTSDSGRNHIQKPVSLYNLTQNGITSLIGPNCYFEGVKAFSQSVFLAYGQHLGTPVIIRSSDGGNSFQIVFYGIYAGGIVGGIRDLIFPVDGNIGYACDPNRVLKTTDGGITWTIIYALGGENFHKVAARNNNYLFVASSSPYSRIYKSINGGNAWNLMPNPAQNAALIQSIYFNIDGEGWLSVNNTATDSAYLYKTVNMLDWTLVANSHNLKSPFLQMKFFDSNNGLALGSDFRILKTTSAGSSWYPLERDNHFQSPGWSHVSLSVISSSVFIAAGGQQFTELTTNGGGNLDPWALFKVDTSGVYSTHSVSVLNFSLNSSTSKWYVNSNLVGTTFNISYTHQNQSARDTVTLISSLNGKSDTLTRYVNFPVPNAPSITWIYPTWGSKGSALEIHGTKLNTCYSLKIGGIPVSYFQIASDTVIRAVVSQGASGNVELLTLGGYAQISGYTYFDPITTPPPIITGFTPQKAVPGTLISINGSNFGNSIANNKVSIGNLNAEIISATSTNIVCRVPVGSSNQVIRVLNRTTSQSGTSRIRFIPLFADSTNFTNNSFKINNQYSDASYYTIWHAVDFDEDSKLDYVSVRSSNSFYSNGKIARNTSTPDSISFSDVQFQGALVNVLGATDLDNDGKVDLLANRTSNGNLYKSVIYRNIGSPGNIQFALDSSVFPLIGGFGKLADFDNDGYVDVVTTHNSTPFYLMRNTSRPGFISFTANDTLPLADTLASEIMAEDFDGDGKTDLAIELTFPSHKIVFFRNISTPGNFAFERSQNLPFNYGQSDCILMDYNGDNKIDLINNGTSLTFARNISTPGHLQFADTVSIPKNSFNHIEAFSYLNGDDKPDLIGSTPTGSNLTALEFQGADNQPNFRVQQVANMFGDPHYGIVADFNGDGKDDIIGNWYNSPVTTVFINRVGQHLTQRACESNSTNITSDVSGTIYKWQRMTSPGVFTDLSDDAEYTGTHSSTLRILSPQISWDGFQYRCFVNNYLYSTVVRLKMQSNPENSVTIFANSDTFCYPGNVIYTAVRAHRTGYSYNYEWFYNGGSNTTFGDSTYGALSVKSSDTVYCKMTYMDSCGVQHTLTSNKLGVVVLGSPGTLTLSTPSNAYCAGGSVILNLSSQYSQLPISWYLNNQLVPNQNSSIYIITPSGGSHIYASQTLPNGCTMLSNSISLTQVSNCPCTNNTWTGNADNHWENPANWSCGSVPGPNSIAIVNFGMPVVTSNVSVYGLILGPGTSIIITSGFMLNVLH